MDMSINHTESLSPYDFGYPIHRNHCSDLREDHHEDHHEDHRVDYPPAADRNNHVEVVARSSNSSA
eukprot:CAMPEP_0171297760 /NCGR_PEP_ID=MMETSP0816-20121228/6503_1 /TAXON_ID=420281 /ORGANISM="Proboscia inermis, Strain CCAP1064/1" /LENGTH=65 /DNA_ID=CAMNT_0011772271 /DNA_START=276 /DNA_END=469 /DNA_ORIENTATION=+